MAQAARKTLYMETTKIPAERTVDAIVKCLAAHALVRETAQSYGEDGQINGVRFTVVEAGCVPCTFRLPARVEPVFMIINARRKYPWKYTEQDRDQAHRVAWRQVLRWIEAQLALMGTGMASAQEVFMPYLLVGAHDGPTAFEVFAESQLKALPAGEAAATEETGGGVRQ